MKELCLPPGNVGRMVVIGQSTDLHPLASRPPRRAMLGPNRPATNTRAGRRPPYRPGLGVHDETITTLAARRLPRPAGLPAAYQTRSSLPRSGCLTSDTVVNPPVPNSSWVCILTDSVWVPAANATVSWPNTSGST